MSHSESTAVDRGPRAEPRRHNTARRGPAGGLLARAADGLTAVALTAGCASTTTLSPLPAGRRPTVRVV